MATSPITPDRLKQLMLAARAKKDADNKPAVLPAESQVSVAPQNLEVPSATAAITISKPATPAAINLSLAEKLAALRAAKGMAPAPAIIGEAQRAEQGVPTATAATATTDKLKALLATVKKEEPIKPQELEVLSHTPAHMVPAATSAIGAVINQHGKLITYNEEQERFIHVAAAGGSAILIGAAGTGKTTCMKGTVAGLIQSGRAGVMEADGHKHLIDGTPGIVCVSYTRRAVANLRKAMDEGMKKNCLTIHALLEYEPVYYTVIDEVTGNERTTMRFEPTRNSSRPLPSTIRCCVIDESSMVSTDLFAELKDALPPDCQFIFLGDIQQLPPVFGPAILGYKMLELPTVELVQVYRQALESPIIRLAHRILSGKPIPASEYAEWKFPNQLTLHPWKKKLSAEVACMTISKFLTVAMENGAYDPLEDMVLIPFNKACGTIEINNSIANYMARKHGRVTHEIIAGFNKLYFSVGDKVLYDKEDATIIDIQVNASYAGASFQPASTSLDYWGFNSGEGHHVDENATESDDDIDFLLSQMSAADDGEGRVRQASHVITVKMLDSGYERELTSAADLNALILSYALTIHKSQGSEWRKVFLMLHQSHATMLQRELLYTGVTRAREELYVICEPDSFTNGINSQKIKGNTLAEKAEFFKGRERPASIK